MGTSSDKTGIQLDLRRLLQPVISAAEAAGLAVSAEFARPNRRLSWISLWQGMYRGRNKIWRSVIGGAVGKGLGR
jgi:hypothetical protein